ncbi:MAG: hypothetical protein ACE5Q6_13470 [Dehalococcoidia bacterium]
MCKAGFSSGGLPVINALVLFPAHLVSRRATPPPLQFLIDTGADATMISAFDAPKLGIVYQADANGVQVPYFGGAALPQGASLGGVGGGINAYEVNDVTLILTCELDNGLTEYHSESLEKIYIPEGNVPDIPNLLGRDILSRFDILWKSGEKTIDFTRCLSQGRWSVSVG